MTDTRVTISKERYDELLELEKERQSGAGFRSFPLEKSLQMEADAEKWQTIAVPFFGDKSTDALRHLEEDAKLGELVWQMPNGSSLSRGETGRFAYNHCLGVSNNPGFNAGEDPSSVLRIAYEREGATKEAPTE